MPKIKYQDIKFSATRLAVVQQANAIISEYIAQGFDLTLRQLYYQFVSRDLIANTQREYAKLGSIINDARLGGLIDWDTIVDRTRFVRSQPHWKNGNDIVAVCASQFNLDKWVGQKHRVEVWIEKDALIGVFEGVCQELDVPLFSCRGYTSQSEMWGAAQRLMKYRGSGQAPFILHFGDHDPSGKDMSRDIEDRLSMFTGAAIKFERLALNMEQIDKYEPPPNPCKVTDSRANGYIAEFGTESWELDALEPAVLAELVRSRINRVVNHDKMQAIIERQNEERATLTLIADNYNDVKSYLDEVN